MTEARESQPTAVADERGGKRVWEARDGKARRRWNKPTDLPPSSVREPLQWDAVGHA